ncbi:glycosyltransferase [Pusillimonas sp. TS35]|uniref:glycosyltransferase family 4 protein n=1 Tax=Paracandidimonas lactea TaxID=2895524 RepID=UPI00136B70E2|nr:glycosyltransferase family 4 protein [Paracandidimonas lactea]MYN13579.1 glycosyltransferase [Pusillimonas sp. TS35]
MKKVLILGIDTFAAKNVPQIEMLGRRGYAFTIATCDVRGDSARHFASLDASQHRLMLLGANPVRRLREVAALLRDGPYNHVELYAGGRFTAFYLPLLRYYKADWIVVERGDIGSIDTYSFSTRLLIGRAYKAANAVWYKEPYMLPLLAKAGSRKLYFIPNAASIPAPASTEAARNVDFLWANRFVHVRHPDWVARAARSEALADKKFVMLGLQDNGYLTPTDRALQNEVRQYEDANLSLHGFVDTATWYPRARFFVLPARLVFGNNALLEAMAHGVVPIVTESPGIDKLVTNGVNGIVCARDEPAFRDAVIRAARMPDDIWRAMSHAAVDTIETRFNLDVWSARMAKMYEELA